MITRFTLCSMADLPASSPMLHPVVSGETGETRLVRRIVRQMELGNAGGLGQLQGLRGRLRRVLNDEKRVDALGDEVLDRCDLLRRSSLSDDVQDGPAFALREGLEDLKARLVEIVGGVHVVADDLRLFPEPPTPDRQPQRP